MNAKTLCLVFLLALSAWLGWTTLNLALENDGLRQVTAGHKQSIEALLDYVAVATKCEITPGEISEALHVAVPDRRTNEVAHLAFVARFEDRGIAEVEVVGVKKVRVCRTQ
jgi:hypothetical protein